MRFDWYYDPPEDDLPEECPECGKENWTDDGVWVAPDAIPFCSVACRDAYNDAHEPDGEDEARYEADRDRWEAMERRL